MINLLDKVQDLHDQEETDNCIDYLSFSKAKINSSSPSIKSRNESKPFILKEFFDSK